MSFTFSIKPVNSEGTPLENGVCGNSGRLPANSITVSGANVAAYIKKPGQGIPYCFYLKRGGFTFALTHGDGTVITEASGLLSYIKVYNSAKVLIATTSVWDAGINKWRVTLDDPNYADENGYFAVYTTTENGLSVQYPYRYLAADKWNSNDLIPTGDYSDTIPYWEVDGIVDGPEYSGECAEVGLPYINIIRGGSFTRSRTIKTSVNFRTTYYISNGNVGLNGLSKGGGTGADCSNPIDICTDLAYNQPQPLVAWNLGGVTKQHYWVGAVTDDTVVGSYSELTKTITVVDSSPETYTVYCTDWDSGYPYPQLPYGGITKCVWINDNFGGIGFSPI